jgi:hypothetical protein
VFIALLESFDLGLSPHHFQRGLHRHDARPDDEQIEDHGQNDDRPAPIANAVVVEKTQSEVKRLGYERQPAKIGRGRDRLLPGWLQRIGNFRMSYLRMLLTRGSWYGRFGLPPVLEAEEEGGNQREKRQKATAETGGIWRFEIWIMEFGQVTPFPSGIMARIVWEEKRVQSRQGQPCASMPLELGKERGRALEGRSETWTWRWCIQKLANPAISRVQGRSDPRRWEGPEACDGDAVDRARARNHEHEQESKQEERHHPAHSCDQKRLVIRKAQQKQAEQLLSSFSPVALRLCQVPFHASNCIA